MNDSTDLFAEARAAFEALCANAPPSVSISMARDAFNEALESAASQFRVVEHALGAQARKERAAERVRQAAIAEAKAKKAAEDRAELLRILRAELRRKQLLSQLSQVEKDQ